jgi:hypothetical protein
MMGVVLAVALATLALRKAGVSWARSLMSVTILADVLLTATTLLLILIATVAIFGADRPRGGRLGFVALGGGYFVLAFLVLSEDALARLPTSWLLSFVHQQVSPPPTVTVAWIAPTPVPRGKATAFLFPDGQVPRRVVRTTANPPSPTWQSLFPGAADSQAFSVVGHCLFAFLAGWVGMIVSKRMVPGRSPETVDSVLPTESPNAL